MAKENKTRDMGQGAPHVTLTKYRARKAFALFVTCALTALFSAWIWAGLRRPDMPWYAIGLPIVFIGLLTNFLQPEEEWNYSPWQETTQKYEKNIYD